LLGRIETGRVCGAVAAITLNAHTLPIVFPRTMVRISARSRTIFEGFEYSGSFGRRVIAKGSLIQQHLEWPQEFCRAMFSKNDVSLVRN
jgi:hypothetical protein